MKIHLISLQALIQVQFQHSCCISVVHCANPVNLTGGIYNISVVHCANPVNLTGGIYNIKKKLLCIHQNLTVKT